RKRKDSHGLSFVPDELLDIRGIRHTWAMIYGLARWADFFTPRQALALGLFAEAARRVTDIPDASLYAAVRACLALAVDRQADSLSSVATWTPGGEFQGHTFARQALPMVWDFAEVNPLSDSSGNWLGAIEWIARVCEAGAMPWPSAAHVEGAPATANP